MFSLTRMTGSAFRYLLPALALMFLLAPRAVWAEPAFDDAGENQIYAYYVAGQQGADSNNEPNDTENDEKQGDSALTPGDDKSEADNTDNVENTEPDKDAAPDNSENNNQENDSQENNSQENSNQENNTQTVVSTDFPALADSLQVLLWDADSKTNKKTQVTPVNLALRGAYLPSDVPAMAVSGRTLVPVRLISEQLQASVVWDKATNTVTISLDNKTIVLTIGSSTALVDGRPVEVDVSVSLVTYESVARTMVPVRFVVENLSATVNYDQTQRLVNIIPPVRQSNTNNESDDTNINNQPLPEPEPEIIPPPGIDENGNLLRRVVLDAGHGGIDPGTNGSGYNEKDINLAVTQKLQAELQKAGFEVFMTRDDDSYVDLVERAAMTVLEDAPVFVSIHCNSAANIPTASGIETYAAPDDAEDAALAGFIQKELIAATGAKDRGVKTSSLVVLTHNTAPACLVEIGFMSNSAECAKIADSTYQQKLAEAVSAGVQAYFAAKAEQ